MNDNVVETPAGCLTLAAGERGIKRVYFGICDVPFGASNTLLEQARTELDEYFCGLRKAFTLPLEIEGTAFQRRAWEELLKIPYGCTVSYGELAARIGSPKAARAVGMANHQNPLPVLIPCHRVIGMNGALTGYAGGLEFKKYLLKLEGSNVRI